MYCVVVMQSLSIGSKLSFIDIIIQESEKKLISRESPKHTFWKHLVPSLRDYHMASPLL